MKTDSFIDAIDALKHSKPVVFPTDTIYGLGVAVKYSASPRAIYDIKQRDADKPIAWLVGGPEALDEYGVDVPEKAYQQAELHWPGALTIVVKASEKVPPAFRAVDGTIGLRMPANESAMRLIRVVGPIAASSANLSDGESPCAAEDLDPDLLAKVAAVVTDDEPCSGIASTVLDCTKDKPVIIRQGDVEKGSFPQAAEANISADKAEDDAEKIPVEDAVEPVDEEIAEANGEDAAEAVEEDVVEADEEDAAEPSDEEIVETDEEDVVETEAEGSAEAGEEGAVESNDEEVAEADEEGAVEAEAEDADEGSSIDSESVSEENAEEAPVEEAEDIASDEGEPVSEDGIFTVPFDFVSHSKKARVNAKLWTSARFGGPDDPGAEDPKAVIQIVHGMAEHIDRYDEFARYLVSRGFVVCAEDHVGHGGTATGRDDYGHIPLRGGRNIVVGDVHTLHRMVARTFPDVPYVMYGHSMGSFITRAYIARYGNELDACVLSGTGNVPANLSKLGGSLARFIASIRGETHRSKLIDNMGAGAYGKKIPNARTKLDWLSTDDAVVDEYIADEKCGFMFTVGGYATLLDLTAEVVTPECAEAVPNDLPILLVAGDGDPVGDMGKGVKAAAQLLRDSGCQTVDCKIYAGMRHEIHNEIGKEQVYDDVATWIEEHVS